jgi:hypothetical protein
MMKEHPFPYVGIAVDHRGNEIWHAAGKSVPDLMARADSKIPKAYNVTIRGDRTSDGTVWGPGQGKVEAVRERGTWRRY